jgi:DNA-directed RNA polymerase specialized sigma subunit
MDYVPYLVPDEQDDEWIRHQYQLTPVPPKRDLQDYIRTYKETGDEQQLLFYLHWAEKPINRKTENLCERYRVLHHFADIKSIIIKTLIEILPKYDLSVGTTFWQYAYRSILDAVDEYVRSSCSAASMNSSQYRNLKQVNGLYFEYRSCCYSYKESIAKIAEKLRLPLVQVIWFLKISLGFRYYPSVDEIITNEDGEEIYAYPVSDYSLVPDSYVPFQIMMNDVKNVIMHLPYKQRNMFLESTGVCEICWKKTKRKTYAEIANEYELLSEQTIGDNRRRVAENICNQMFALGYRFFIIPEE